jgi:hypothetical protein
MCAHEPEHRVPDRGQHAAHLAVATLVYLEHEPAGRVRVPHRWVAWPWNRWRGFDAQRARRAISQLHAAAQAGEGIRTGDTGDLDHVALAHAVPRVGDARLYGAVIRQQHQAFRVEVEAARGVDVGEGHVVRKRGARHVRGGRVSVPCRVACDRRPVGELAQHAEGLVQEHEFRHADPPRLCGCRPGVAVVRGRGGRQRPVLRSEIVNCERILGDILGWNRPLEHLYDKM